VGREEAWAALAALAVTYDRDPREDPETLTRPAAVVVQGVRRR
jgi:hypothetical protein